MTHCDRAIDPIDSNLSSCSSEEWPSTFAEWLALPNCRGPRNSLKPILAPMPPIKPSRELQIVLGGVHQRARKVLIAGIGSSSLASNLAERFGSAVVLHPSKEYADALKSKPLGSKGSIARTLRNKERWMPELRAHEIRPGIEFRHGLPVHMGLPNSSFDLVIIEQPHWYDLRYLAAEVQRVACPAATVIYVGYMLANVAPPVNAAMKCSYETLLARSLNWGERQLLRGFDARSFPFSNARSETYFGQRPVMFGKWRLTDLLAYLDHWPVIRRLETVAEKQLDLWRMREMLADGWGPVRHKREVRLPVFIHSGIVEKLPGAERSSTTLHAGK